MAKTAPALRKALLILSLLSILLCPFLYIASEFFTDSLAGSLSTGDAFEADNKIYI
jgi:hypothetical protein